MAHRAGAVITGLKELAATVDVCRTYVSSPQHKFQLGEIRSWIDQTSYTVEKRSNMGKDYANTLEEWIDELEEGLPELKFFILPGGGLGSSFLHVARTVCRRTERRAAVHIREGHVVPGAGIFLNRLSDYFFVAARYECHHTHGQEVIYRKT